MNFDDTPAEADFRGAARSWIEANAPHWLRAQLERAGFGSLVLDGANVHDESKAWQRAKYDAGWACLHWPREYGGRAASPIERVIWQQEEGAFARLSSIFGLGQGMCGPTLMVHGEEALKRDLLPRIASGESIWCQLFSEPAAGSDLAGLRTRAEPVDGGWAINGQKIWTSGAHYADWGLLLARTDPHVPKHQGLTMFFIDMRTIGIAIRPIRQMNGQSSFNEVFLTDVHVPDRQRLGGIGDGWQVALTTLMHERLSIGHGIHTGFEELFGYCMSRPHLFEDSRVVSQLGRWAARANGLAYTAMRSVSALSRGLAPGPENSIGKLVAGTMIQDIARFVLDLEGIGGLEVDRGSDITMRLQTMLMRSPGSRIEGGTDEILRNIIAERVLGLPGDIRIDKEPPFTAVRSG